MAHVLRRRLFLTMVGFGTLPLAVALVILVVQSWSAGSPTGPRAAIDEIAESGRALLETVDTTAMAAAGRAAIRDHTETIAQRTSLARRAEALSQHAAAVFGVGLALLAAVVVAASLWLARRWSHSISAPIEELVDSVRRIERGEDLPALRTGASVPEFDRLRQALVDMAQALARARAQELEQERLRVFRETARKVAHEMRGPLTATRLAVRRLGVAGDADAAAVLVEETRRLEQMAKVFAEFGRLPEGPTAEIEVPELLESAIRATVSDTTPVHRSVPASLTIRGHYEPLRRAVRNLLQNAVDASRGGAIRVMAERLGAGGVRILIADTGPGIPADLRERVFEPYYTTKAGGTGLGLALVRQTVLAHGGTIQAKESLEGGAAFVLELPGQP